MVGRDMGDETGAVPTIDLVLGAMARRTGVEYIFDTDLDGIELEAGEHILVREASGRLWDAEVNWCEAVPSGVRYQLRLRLAG